MMTTGFSLGLFCQGYGHDDMTMQKTAKYHHHAIITCTYDDMTKVQVFPRERMCIKALYPP